MTGAPFLPRRLPRGGTRAWRVQAAKPETGGSTAWMVTFTDLVALLLAFFVMLFAMSKVDLRKWHNLTDALARGLNAVSQEATIEPRHALDVEVDELTVGQDLDYLAGVLSQQLSANSPLAGTAIRRYEDRLVIELPPNAYGPSQNGAAGGGALFHVAGVLRQLRNRIELVGYSDPDDASARSLSVWELSLLRARAAADRLHAAGYEHDVSLRGKAMNASRSAPAEDTKQEREGEAGKVELVVRLDAAENR